MVKKKTIAIIGGLLLILIALFMIFGPIKNTAISGTGQTFNNGGRFVLDIHIPTTVRFEEGTLERPSYSADLSIYPGSGWKKICFTGEIDYYVQKAGLLNQDEKIYDKGRTGYSTISHYADGVNRPYLTGTGLTLDISKYPPGEYSINFVNFMTPFTDTPYTGQCAYTSSWDNGIVAANAQYNFNEFPLEWMRYFAGQNFIRTDYLGSTNFIIDAKETAPPPQPQPIPNPTPSHLPSEESKLNKNLIGGIIGIVLIILGFIVFMRRMKKK